jgi:GR25 family glycosyltransferase involved in LPS biosynthesis
MLNESINIYYINLHSQTERREVLEGNLSKFIPRDIEVKRIEAMGQHEVLNLGIVGNIRATEKACFLSHQKAIEASLLDDGHALILEDDALVGPSTIKMLTLALQMMKDDFDLVYTDACIPDIQNMVILAYLKKKLHINEEIQIINLQEINFAGASAYLVHRNFKKNYLNFLTHISNYDTPYDLFIRDLVASEKLRGKLIFPFITSLSDQSLLTQNQLSRDKLRNLAWDAFRKIMFIDSLYALNLPLAGFNEISSDFYDQEATQFSEILKLMLSKNFK